MKITSVVKFATALLLLASLYRAAAQTTSGGTNPPVTNLGSGGQDGLTYQGRLLGANGTATAGNYDFVFSLFTTNKDGGPIAGPITNSAVAVDSNGLFTTLILIPYTSTYLLSRQSNYLFLDIAVTTNGNGTFTTLTPRQLLTPSLQSMYAVSAGTANGMLASAVIQGQSLSVGQSNTLGGAYSTIAGGGNNAATLDYAVVAGGFGNTASSNNAAVGGGLNNVASGDYAVVAGGEGNIASGTHTFVGGGYYNLAGSDDDVIVGGVSNIVSGDPAFLGGGVGNWVYGFASWGACGAFNRVFSWYSGLGGGGLNIIQTNSNFSFLGGGLRNTIQSYATYSFIGSGDNNIVQSNAMEAVISGGTGNTIQTYAADSTISGGFGNVIGGGYNVFSGVVNTAYATVGGGFENTASNNNSTVSGGGNNTAGAQYATVGGGYNNQATNSFATIPGGQRAVAGNYAQQAYSSGMFTNAGDSQYSLYVLRGQTTTNCTACNVSYLYLDGSSLEIALPANRSVAFNMNIVARSPGTSAQTTVFFIRGGASGLTGNVGIPVVEMPLNELGLPLTSVNIIVSGGFLHVLAAGPISGPDVYWTATVQTAEESD
jgi:hypothetical protein